MARPSRLDHDTAIGNGESLASVDARVHAELDALLADPTSLLHRHDEHLAIVSHVSPIKSATVWALGVPGSVAWRMRLRQRVDHHDRDASLRAHADPLQHGAAARLISEEPRASAAKWSPAPRSVKAWKSSW